MTVEQREFIKTVSAMAVTAMRKHSILASLKIAQAILESGWGRSMLTVKANALYGIKATAAWQGRVYSAKTQECYDGINFTTIKALFRAYDSWADSCADHSALITGLPRYRHVIGETDYIKASREIHRAGYATDPAYSDKLIRLIEQFSLYEFDSRDDTGIEKGEEYEIVKAKKTHMKVRVDGVRYDLVSFHHEDFNYPHFRAIMDLLGVAYSYDDETKITDIVTAG